MDSREVSTYEKTQTFPCLGKVLPVTFDVDLSCTLSCVLVGIIS